MAGWAIVTFIEHGPSASASAKGSIVLDINTATGPPEEFGLDQPSGPPTQMKTTTTLSIDKLAFKVRAILTLHYTCVCTVHSVDCTVDTWIGVWGAVLSMHVMNRSLSLT